LPPPQTPPPPPQPENNPKNNEGGDNASKWTLGDDRRLVKLWINVSTNPLTGSDQKKSGFWAMVAQAFNQAAPSGSVRNHQKSLTPVEIGLLHWCQSGVGVWRRHIGRSQVGQMRMTLFKTPMIYMRLKWEKSLISLH